MFSFSARKKTVDVQRYLRRMIDLTIPNKADPATVNRFENRHNRSIPALLCPWVDGAPSVAGAVMGITKDVADVGVGLILTSPFEAEDVVLAFRSLQATAGEPWFFRGEATHNLPIGGGFWLLGIGLKEFMNESWKCELEVLLPLTQELLPPLCQAR